MQCNLTKGGLSMKTIVEVGDGEGFIQQVDVADKYGHTALMVAARDGKVTEVDDLLNRGASLTARSDKGKTPLHYAAANGRVEVVQLLLSKGAEVDPRDKEGHTPLMLAANYGCDQSLQALIRHGADALAMSHAGITAMAYAEQNRHPDTLKLLMKSLKSN
jgi:uncharacterized protein